MSTVNAAPPPSYQEVYPKSQEKIRLSSSQTPSSTANAAASELPLSSTRSDVTLQPKSSKDHVNDGKVYYIANDRYVCRYTQVKVTDQQPASPPEQKGFCCRFVVGIICLFGGILLAVVVKAMRRY